MRILIYGINYAPELTGVGKYSSEMAEWLAARGHEVLIVTAPPYYPEWQIAKGYSGWQYRQETRNGVRVVRCPLWVPAKLSGFERIIHLASFALSSFPVLLLNAAQFRPDLILTVIPTFLCAPGALVAAALARTKTWLHIQDFDIDAAFSLGIISRGPAQYLIAKLESLLLSKFANVSTISNEMLARLHAKGVAATRTSLLPNWVDTTAIKPLEQPSRYRQELGIANEVIVCLYSGNIGEKQGLEVIPQVAQMLQEVPNLFFVICGEGAAKERIHRLTSGLTNLAWLPLQPTERLNDLLNLADIHLLPQRSNATGLVLPSKLLGMFASGRPIVVQADQDTELAKVIETRGIVVPPDNHAALAEAINNLRNNKKLRLQLGQSGRSYAEENLDIGTILRKVETYLLASSQLNH
jgi:colanic acid biosynthesis glycosyl transferase WcaI